MTFDRVMVLTSNLEHYTPYVKRHLFANKSIYDDVISHQTIWRAKNDKHNFVIFGAPFWVKFSYS